MVGTRLPELVLRLRRIVKQNRPSSFDFKCAAQHLLTTTPEYFRYSTCQVRIARNRAAGFAEALFPPTNSSTLYSEEWIDFTSRSVRQDTCYQCGNVSRLIVHFLFFLIDGLEALLIENQLRKCLNDRNPSPEEINLN
jgi:hypothetical protein